MYDCFRLYRRGFLDAEPVLAFGWRVYVGDISIVGDFSTTLEMTTCPIKASPLGEAPPKAVVRGRENLKFRRYTTPHPSLGSLTLALVPPSPKGEGFKSASRRGRVFGVVVYECFRFLCRGFLDFARNDIGVRLVGGGTRNAPYKTLP